MSDLNNVFLKDNYATLIDPINNYVNETSLFLSKKFNIDIKEAEQFIRNEIKTNKKFINPRIKYYERDENLDRQEKTGRLNSYLYKAIKDRDILTPPLTVYDGHKKNLSFQVEYIFNNVKLRKQFKNKMFDCKANGDIEGMNANNVLQKRKKISNNSVSGSYCSKGTVLYNPSAHYSLTSITRCVASLGNATAESMIAGNRHYRNPDIVMNHLISMIKVTDRKSAEIAISRYGLKQPTVDDVMKMIKYSTDLYWTNDEKMSEIRRLVNTFDGIERAIVMYVNDFYHLRVHNDVLLRDMLDNLSTIRNDYSGDLKTAIKQIPEFILNQVHHVVSEDLKGKKVDYEKMIETGETLKIVSTALGIMRTLEKYDRLFKAFYITDNIPISIAYLPDILRRVTVLSDTDSTCATYQEWSEWWFGKITFNEKSIGLTAGVMTIVTKVLDHILKQFTANMNIGEEYNHLLAMKNEFYWNTMTPMNVSKHYFADTFIQEGLVLDPTDLEKKGVHMIASKIPGFLREESTNMMKEINQTTRENKKIDLQAFIKRVADLEREIIKRVMSSDTEILLSDKIKEESSYTQDKLRSPYFHYIMWKEVFGDRYGDPGEPPYRAVRVSTTLDTRKKIENFIESIEDSGIKEKFKIFVNKYNKDRMGSFRLPFSIVTNTGIPKELANAIDIDKIISTNLNVHYMILSGIGFYKPDGLKLIDMGY